MDIEARQLNEMADTLQNSGLASMARYIRDTAKEITNLRQQLAEQTSAEPHVWMDESGRHIYAKTEGYFPLYRHPPSVEVLLEALRNSMTAIDDWLNLYASEHCNIERVEEARKRIGKEGTVAYIADVQEKNRLALSTYKPKEG